MPTRPCVDLPPNLGFAKFTSTADEADVIVRSWPANCAKALIFISFLSTLYKLDNETRGLGLRVKRSLSSRGRGCYSRHHDDPRQYARTRRALAVRHLWCGVVPSRAVLDVSAFADDVTVPSFGPRMVCTVCGAIGADARPNWNERASACLFGPQRP